MTIPPAALELENRSIGVDGEPTLGAAYDILVNEWRTGNQTRELGLHLMFLAWYLLCEPPHLTGLIDPDTPLAATFNEIHEHFEPTIRQDPEMLYVVGLMAHLFPYLLGEDEMWARISREYRGMYRRQVPGGIDSTVFKGRGAYGDYFADQAAVRDGY